MNVLEGLAVLLFCVSLHEMGHAFVGWRRGLKLAGIGLGIGPGIVVRRRRWPPLHLGMLPVIAYVEFEDTEASVRDLPTVLAGPLGSLVAAVLLGLLALPFAANAHQVVAALIVGLLGFLLGTPPGVLLTALVFPFTLGDISGPLGITNTLAQAATGGPYDLLITGSLISGAIGGFNLFPVPPLDGGHVALELARRRFGTHSRVDRIVRFAGLLVLAGVLLMATYHDVLNVLSGHVV